MKEVRPLDQAEFQDGLSLVSGERISWGATLEDLVAANLIRLDDGPSPVYETTSAVQLGPWILPRLSTHPSRLISPDWIPQSWHLEFPEFAPKLTPDQLHRSVTGLNEGKPYYFDPQASHYFIIGRNIQFSLAFRAGAWNLGLTIAHDVYWDRMRRRHPVTRRLAIDRIRSVEAFTTTGSFDVSQFTNPEVIPTPFALAHAPLGFWEDRVNGWQGVSSHTTSHYWKKGEVENLTVRADSFPGDRGGTDEFSIVTLRLRTRGELQVSFGGTPRVPVDELLAWLRQDS